MQRRLLAPFLATSSPLSLPTLNSSSRYLCHLQQQWARSQSGTGHIHIIYRGLFSTASSDSPPECQHSHHKAPKDLHPDCWSCGYSSPDLMFCNSCGKLQSLLVDENYYELFSQPKKVEVCGSSLEAEFRKMQSKLHPDKYANASATERDISLTNSSIVNQAYQTLKRPEDRIAYLLNTYGVTALAEDSLSFVDPELMIDMFELREEIEQLALSSQVERDEEKWMTKHQELIQSVDEEVSDLLPSLQEYFDNKQLDKATSLAVRLKYLFKAKEELLKMI